LARGLAAGVVVAAAVVVCAIVLSARSPAPREIHIVAREMTFYVDGEDEPNPTLHLRAGEDVRIVFRNDDAGIKHDFTIPDWGVATRRLAGKSETTISFRAPAQRTAPTYQCGPHAAMMRGTIAVE
jgi:plastocyanin domain-containing protein